MQNIESIFYVDEHHVIRIDFLLQLSNDLNIKNFKELTSIVYYCLERSFLARSQGYILSKERFSAIYTLSFPATVPKNDLVLLFKKDTGGTILQKFNDLPFELLRMFNFRAPETMSFSKEKIKYSNTELIYIFKSKRIGHCLYKGVDVGWIEVSKEMSENPDIEVLKIENVLC